MAFDINGEALLVDKNGAPVKGFTNKSSVFDRALGEPGKTYYPLKGLVEDNKIDLYFDCGYNDLFGNIQNDGKVEYIIDAGRVDIGVESTVIRVVDGVVHILRPGKITPEDIENLGIKVFIEKQILRRI